MLSLVGTLCENVDDSHNKTLHKSFFDDVQTMIKTSDVMKIIKFKEKWKGKPNMSSDERKIEEALEHGMIPCIAGHGVKKSFDRKSVKFQAYAKKCHVVAI